MARTIASSNQVTGQYTCMAAKVRLIGTYAPQSEGLAVSYTSLTVSRVTTGGMEILMSVGGLRIQVSSECIVGLNCVMFTSAVA